MWSGPISGLGAARDVQRSRSSAQDADLSGYDTELEHGEDGHRGSIHGLEGRWIDGRGGLPAAYPHRVTLWVEGDQLGAHCRGEDDRAVSPSRCPPCVDQLAEERIRGLECGPHGRPLPRLLIIDPEEWIARPDRGQMEVEQVPRGGQRARLPGGWRAARHIGGRRCCATRTDGGGGTPRQEEQLDALLGWIVVDQEILCRTRVLDERPSVLQ